MLGVLQAVFSFMMGELAAPRIHSNLPVADLIRLIQVLPRP